METKICEAYTKIKTHDNVKQPLIHLGNNEKGNQLSSLKNLGYFWLFYTHADLINRHDIWEKEKWHNFIKKSKWYYNILNWIVNKISSIKKIFSIFTDT